MVSIAATSILAGRAYVKSFPSSYCWLADRGTEQSEEDRLQTKGRKRWRHGSDTGVLFLQNHVPIDGLNVCSRRVSKQATSSRPCMNKHRTL